MRAARFFAAAYVVSALLVVFGLFALPARVIGVDLGGALVAVALLASGIGCVRFGERGRIVARVGSAFILAVGLALIAALSLSVSYLRGIYGGVGRGGEIVFVLLIFLVAPYLIVLPAAALVWIGPSKAKSPP